MKEAWKRDYGMHLFLKLVRLDGKSYTGFSQEKRAVFYKVFDIFPANRRISVEKS